MCLSIVKPSRWLAFVFFLSFFPFIAQSAYDRRVPADYVPRLLQNGPKAYFDEINSGWLDEQYGNLRSKLIRGRSYVVIHNRLPNTTFDLRTPNGYRESVFKLGVINLPKLDQGHVMISWSCDINGKTYEGATGITGEQTNQQMLMASSGWGVTGLFSIFKDGHLQTPTLVGSVFRQAIEKRQSLTTLAFEVEPQQCARMMEFLRKFLAHEKQPYRNFGLNADPLKFEGGGCGSFAASALFTTGAVPSGSSIWRTLKINKKAFGYGIENPSKDIDPFRVPHAPGESNKVSLLSGLFLKNWNPTSKENTVSARIMDPELLFLLQQTVMRASLDDVYRDSLRMGRALMASPHVKHRVLKHDVTEIPGSEDSGAYRLAETRVNEHFDPQAAAVVRDGRAWLKSMRAKGYKARGFEFNGEPAVLLAR
jgi:hypothetical protein